MRSKHSASISYDECELRHLVNSARTPLSSFAFAIRFDLSDFTLDKGL